MTNPVKRIVFYGLTHGGGDTIIDWYLRNLNQGKKVEISLNGNQILTNQSRDLLYYHQVLADKLPTSPHEDSAKTIVYYCSEQSITSLDQVDYQIVILRDPLNLIASRDSPIDSKFVDSWINHANFCVTTINEQNKNNELNKNNKNNEQNKNNELKNRFFILYNRWVMDRDYRDSICHHFGLINYDVINFNDKINHLTCFQQIKWTSAVVNKLQNDQLISLTQQLFPKIPITEILVTEEIHLEEHPDAIKPAIVLSTNYRQITQVGEKTLGLSMIVKNEEKIITQCLASIADYLDYWIIHDTGSTDGTIQEIVNFFTERNIPGELHQLPWKNFGWNRTQAIRMAQKKTDYCILLDADFIVTVNDSEFKKKLSSPGYLIRYEGGLDYRQILLIECKHNWEYNGVTHEYIDTKPDQMPVELTEFLNIKHTGEGSNRAEKFSRDVALLKQGIIDEPDNARYYFYLAQSYKDWGHYDEAIETYQKRISFGNWDEEVFYSYYQIAICKKRRGDNFYEYIGDFLKAYHVRKQRIEPIYQILEDCAYDQEKAAMGYRIGMMNSRVEYPTFDLLFIEKPLYMWMYLDMLATCAHTAGLYQEALDLTERIIREKNYEPHQERRFQNNSEILRQLIDQEGDHLSQLKPQPFTFVRIQPENKQNRVAVIIANYNMPERANQIVTSISNLDQNYPLDIILVDNGSDQVPPSQYTTLFLAKNVQTTNAWLCGLNYADSLEVNESFKYLSYVFVITSAEVVPQMIPDQGLITPMADSLQSDPDLVGVHPALTVDSTTHWKQLIVQYPPKIRQTNMIDNIFSMYRADWFNSIGRFDRELTFAWGIDLETSYLARKQGKKLVVLDGVLVRKISNIGYQMKRMGMTAEDRFKLASQQMNEKMTRKYGQNWGTEFNQYTIEENVRENYFQILPERLHQLMLGFEKIEGAHRMLMETIFLQHMNYYHITTPLMLLEIGSTRERYPHLDSTRKLCRLSSVYGYHFVTVDSDPKVITQNQNDLKKYDMGYGLTGFRYDCVQARAEDFSGNPEKYLPSLENDPIYFVYLDGDRDETHFTCVKNLLSRFPIGTLICIANHVEKGKTTVSFLLEHGFIMIKEEAKSGILLIRQSLK